MAVNLLHAFHEITDVLDSNEWETTRDPLLCRNMLVEIESIVAKTLHALIVEEDEQLRSATPTPPPDAREP